MKQHSICKGGLFGLLIGDALGVPYEFHPPEEIPHNTQIEMVPPNGFHRSYPSIFAGTWSDDGAQALCLLESLLTCGKFSLDDFSHKLCAWYWEGLWAVDRVVFDVGLQTSVALSACRAGTPPKECGLMRAEGKGNGSLMRTLPLALWHRGTDAELVADAHEQCLITHVHPCNQVCCALYCLTARYLLDKMHFAPACRKAVQTLRGIYSTMPEYEQELEWSVRPDEPWEGKGSGYVVDCLRSAFMILEHASSYEDAVKKAISLGNDTDTTACVTGGLAGILFGFDNIPQRWYESLRAKELLEELTMELMVFV